MPTALPLQSFGTFNMELDDTICFCFHVRKRKILNYLRIEKPSRASQLSECGGAGTGCGWCVAYLKKYFKDFESGNESPDADVAAGDYSAGRVKYLEDGKGVPPK